MLFLASRLPASHLCSPAAPALRLSLSPATLPPPFGSRAGARAVNDCPARGPDPYLHSSAPSPARPPANLRPDTGRPAPAPGRMPRAVVELLFPKHLEHGLPSCGDEGGGKEGELRKGT